MDGPAISAAGSGLGGEDLGGCFVTLSAIDNLTPVIERAKAELEALSKMSAAPTLGGGVGMAGSGPFAGMPGAGLGASVAGSNISAAQALGGAGSGSGTTIIHNHFSMGASAAAGGSGMSRGTNGGIDAGGNDIGIGLSQRGLAKGYGVPLAGIAVGVAGFDMISAGVDAWDIHKHGADRALGRMDNYSDAHDVRQDSFLRQKAQQAADVSAKQRIGEFFDNFPILGHGFKAVDSAGTAAGLTDNLEDAQAAIKKAIDGHEKVARASEQLAVKYLQAAGKPAQALRLELEQELAPYERYAKEHPNDLQAQDFVQRKAAQDAVDVESVVGARHEQMAAYTNRAAAYQALASSHPQYLSAAAIQQAGGIDIEREKLIRTEKDPQMRIAALGAMEQELAAKHHELADWHSGGSALHVGHYQVPGDPLDLSGAHRDRKRAIKIIEEEQNKVTAQREKIKDDAARGGSGHAEGDADREAKLHTQLLKDIKDRLDKLNGNGPARAG